MIVACLLARLQAIGFLFEADPFNGTVGELCKAEECKVEFLYQKRVTKEAMKTIIKVHPYETPVINVLPIINGVGIKEYWIKEGVVAQ